MKLSTGSWYNIPLLESYLVTVEEAEDPDVTVIFSSSLTTATSTNGSGRKPRRTSCVHTQQRSVLECSTNWASRRSLHQ